MAQPDYTYQQPAASGGRPWNTSRSAFFADSYQKGSYEQTPTRPPSIIYQSPTSSAYHLPSGFAAGGHAIPGGGVGSRPGPISRPDTAFAIATSPPCHSRHSSSNGYGANASSFGAAPYKPNGQAQTQSWDYQGRYSPSDSIDDMMGSPSLSDHSLDAAGTAPPVQVKHSGKGRPQRRPSNRDEFDGPHQFLPRLPPDYVARQERELPHLPTNLLVQEQDSILAQINDRLSQCTFDFVAKYQFPIPLSQDMRPIERPQDREWTEWVYLLKRLATKRRIPARVLYNGQIKQFVTILENSLEMRHAAKHQSRPLKDDRNILQLISAGIQVAKILKDALAMDYLDRLYVSTEKQIQERSAAAAARFH